MTLPTTAVLPGGTTIDTGPLNSAFTSHATEVNRIAGYLPTGAASGVASYPPTASVLPLRGGSGELQMAAAIIPMVATLAGLKLTQPGVGSSPFAQFLASNGTTQLAAIDASGNFIGNALTVLGVASASNFIGAMTPSITGLKLTQPAGITNPPFLFFFANDGVTSKLAVDYAGNVISAGNFSGVQGVFSSTVTAGGAIIGMLASTTGLKLTQPAGGSNPDFLEFFALNGTTLVGKVDWAGNLAGFNTANFAGAVTAPAFHGVADSALAMAAAGITDYKATPGTAGQINIAAGDSYRDSNGQTIPAAAPSVQSLPTQPTGTNTQYVAFSKAPTTGSITRTDGVVNDPLANLVVPLVNKPVCTVLLRGATTNPGYVIAAADIFNIRFSDNAGGGGGGGGGGIATSAAVLTEGDLTGAYPNTINVRDSTKGLALHPANIASAVTNDATYNDAFNAYLPPDLVSRITPYSSTQMQLQAGSTNTTGLNSPVTLIVNGRLRKNTTVVATNGASLTHATGSAGTRYIVSDSSITPAGGNGIGLVDPMPTSLVGLSAYQVPLAAVVWDGAAIQPGIIDITNIVNLDSTALSRRQFSATWGAADTFTSNVTTSFTVAPNMGVIGPIIVPTPMTADLYFSVNAFTAGVASNEYWEVCPAQSVNGGAWSAIGNDEGAAWFGQNVTSGSGAGHSNGMASVSLAPNLSYRFSHVVKYNGVAAAATLGCYARVLRAFLYKA